MSAVSAVSGLSGVTAATDLSDGSSLRWKTGKMRKRKEKGEQQREDWRESVKPSQHNYIGGGGGWGEQGGEEEEAGFVGGDGVWYDGVKPAKLNYDLPF
jgi:hypothetical protein